MFKEFFLRRRAFKVGQNIRHMHEDADTAILSGQRLVSQAQQQWESYCENVSPPRRRVRGSIAQTAIEISRMPFEPSEEERKLLSNDHLRSIYQKGFIQGYLAEDKSQSWPDAYVKE